MGQNKVPRRDHRMEQARPYCLQVEGKVALFQGTDSLGDFEIQR